MPRAEEQIVADAARIAVGVEALAQEIDVAVEVALRLGLRFIPGHPPGNAVHAVPNPPEGRAQESHDGGTC